MLKLPLSSIAIASPPLIYVDLFTIMSSRITALPLSVLAPAYKVGDADDHDPPDWLLMGTPSDLWLVLT